MEGPQYQERTARAEPATDETVALTNVIQTLGGILLIGLLSSVLVGVSLAFYWLAPGVPGAVQAISATAVLGLIAWSFAVVLPLKPDQVRDALGQGAGVLLLVYPFMVVKAFVYYDTPGPAYVGLETPHWLVYSISGLMLLVQPRMSRVLRQRGVPQSVLSLLVLFIGVLTAVLTFFLISQLVISGTLYSITLLTASLVLIGFTVLYAICPKAPRTETIPLL